MKKLLCYFAAGAILFASCTENPVNDDFFSEDAFFAQRGCATMEVLADNLAADPGLQSRMDAVERLTQLFIRNGDVARIMNNKVVIPVIVNVIYRTSEENISDAQIQSQLDVLNEDFNKLNEDVSGTPEEFTGVVADFEIEFVLAGTNRKYSPKKSWQTNDAMKKSKQGGIDATDPEHNLNIWVVNRMTWGRYIILGYAQFPGGNPATDGIVVGHQFFGNTGTVVSPFDKGRTATHEVGHWLNLRHIWGDATCGNDFVEDTPVHNGPNYGCPAYPHHSTCEGTPLEMTMNYMDYTDDACMFMFTELQKARSKALFLPGGERYSFVQE